MALSANSVIEVRTAGNDTNGGGFVTGAAGSDWSQQDGKRTGGDVTDISVTDAVAAGTTTITSLTANFATTIVGNIVYFEGGTGTIAACWRQVTARASSSSVTIDAAIATSTGMTMNVGGALATPGMAGAVGLVAGNTIYIKAGTYTIASATPNIATGCFSASVKVVVEGYQTTRGDLGTPPLLQASGISTATLMTFAANDSVAKNLIFDGATLTAIRGFSAGTIRVFAYKLSGINCTNSGLHGTTGAQAWVLCSATGCSTAAAFLTAGRVIGCAAYDNTITGFGDSGTVAYYIRCLADTNTGASSDGFISAVAGTSFYNCIAYGSGRDGIRATTTGNLAINCIVEGNAGVQLNFTGATSVVMNAAGVSGAVTNSGATAFTMGFVTLTTSAFTNAAGQDFTLNTTSGGGAACRAAGIPGPLQVGGTGALDIGALQHADPAGGGGGLLRHGGMTGGMGA